MVKKRGVCQWVALRESLATFALAATGVQGAGHITALHWAIACRLVLEGGFRPEWITPRPPFVYEERRTGTAQRFILKHEPQAARGGEQTILGGLKTKKVDVVVALKGIGPCLAVSVKGTLNAFRNLTNRMEEAVGDCTSLHIAYPALVYGFLHVLRANQAGPVPDNARHFLKPDKEGNIQAPDVAILATGQVTASIQSYHIALAGLASRKGVRNDFTRYEAIALTLVSPDAESLGEIVPHYPPGDSPLGIGDFFRRLYDQYDQRFMYGAPALSRVTRRIEWDAESPAFEDPRIAGFQPRIAAGPVEPPVAEHEIPEEEPDA